jgi:large subunit ribosomal protein L11
LHLQLLEVLRSRPSSVNQQERTAMPARNRVAATVRLQLQAGAASPGKIGQALGPHGINLMAFIGAYNAASAAQRGLVVPVVVTVYDDRSFDLQLKTPPTSALLARAAGLPGGSGRPGTDPPVAKLARDQLREIARTKLSDLNTADLDAAERIVAGTARSMGIEVVHTK